MRVLNIARSARVLNIARPARVLNIAEISEIGNSPALSFKQKKMLRCAQHDEGFAQHDKKDSTDS